MFSPKINLSLCDYQQKKKKKKKEKKKRVCVGYRGIRNLCSNSTCTKT